ncbi:MAG TPA: MdtA/MuxA family multidrug efflux RND transporter periplasmic adaptor subunit [Pirellulales bacterium]|nr:MdtA/MuxA family multidrug efflux RND transporter periplasmic adaptor subunit [Pirellulales bacterium]
MADPRPQATPELLHEVVSVPSVSSKHELPLRERVAEGQERIIERRRDPVPTPSKRSALLRLVVMAGIVTGTYFGWPWIGPWLTSISGRKPITKPPPRVTPVATAVVRKGDLDLYLNGLGTVTAFYTVTVRSRVEGQLTKVLFNEGELVEKDQTLAEIDPRPFEVQLAQAQGQLERDQATLKVNRLSLNRYQELLKTRAVTPQQIDEQVALVAQMEGAIRTDQAAIDNARLQLTYSHITAPIRGRIGLRLVDPGNMVRANDMTGMAVITQLQPIALVFTIPQDSIARVQNKVNRGDELSVEAYDRDFTNKLSTGKLLAVDNQVDSLTGTVRLKAVFENEDYLLFPNQFVNARLLIDRLSEAVISPAAAVQHGPDFDFVYVVKPGKEKDEQVVELRQIKTGPTEGDQTVIAEGLQPGDVVVTDGLDKLHPGAKVSTKKANAK